MRKALVPILLLAAVAGAGAAPAGDAASRFRRMTPEERQKLAPPPTSPGAAAAPAAGSPFPACEEARRSAVEEADRKAKACMSAIAPPPGSPLRNYFDSSPSAQEDACRPFTEELECVLKRVYAEQVGYCGLRKGLALKAAEDSRRTCEAFACGRLLGDVSAGEAAVADAETRIAAIRRQIAGLRTAIADLRRQRAVLGCSGGTD